MPESKPADDARTNLAQSGLVSTAILAMSGLAMAAFFVLHLVSRHDTKTAIERSASTSQNPKSVAAPPTSTINSSSSTSSLAKLPATPSPKSSLGSANPGPKVAIGQKLGNINNTSNNSASSHAGGGGHGGGGHSGGGHSSGSPGGAGHSGGGHSGISELSFGAESRPSKIDFDEVLKKTRERNKT